MESPAIEALKREMVVASDQMAALKVQLRDLKAQVESFESAIKMLGGTSQEDAVVSTTRASRAGERLEDRILAEIHAANGTTARLISAKLTEEGRPTGETTVSSLISRLKKCGKVHRLDDGLVYTIVLPSHTGATAEGGAAATVRDNAYRGEGVLDGL